MQDGLVVFRFGPFEFDPRGGTLVRDKAPVRLSVPQAGILARLLAHAGSIVPKEALIEAGWSRRAIAEASLLVAIHGLRKRLGPTSIETRHHHGYLFTLPVVRVARDVAPGSLDARLEPFLAFVQGRSQVDTLDREQIREARVALNAMLHQRPDYARAHALLALACGLAYEASATDARRDDEALAEGIAHGHRACELADASGEAWGALAFVLSLRGDRTAAAAAGAKAIDLEPENWRLALQLAKVTWGEERVRAGRRVLAFNPDLASAHWLVGTVYVARCALDAAIDELRHGCAAQDAQQKDAPFRAVGNHLLIGQVFGALDRMDEAIVAVQRELASLDARQVWARVCAGNGWYTLGGLLWRLRRRDEANRAFEQALAINPSHIKAMAALHGTVSPAARGMDAATAQAIVLVRGNQHEEAARVYLEGLIPEPPGHVGWMLPIDPILHPLARRAIWEAALALVRSRAH